MSLYHSSAGPEPKAKFKLLESQLKSTAQSHTMTVFATFQDSDANWKNAYNCEISLEFQNEI